MWASCYFAHLATAGSSAPALMTGTCDVSISKAGVVSRKTQALGAFKALIGSTFPVRVPGSLSWGWESHMVMG